MIAPATDFGALFSVHRSGSPRPDWSRSVTSVYLICRALVPIYEATGLARPGLACECPLREKRNFASAKIRSVIASFDAKLAELFQTFYDRSVDFGGHPNPHAAMSTVQMPENSVDKSFTALALSTDKQVLLHAMKSVVQVGLIALFIFQHIFKAKFELLGIRAEMDRLRSENL